MSFSVSCRSRLLGLLLIALPVALASDSVAQQPTSPERVSEFGKYEGYTQAEFEHWVVSSQYIEMRDGVKLAIDIVRPSADGEEPAPGPFPVLWTHSRYHRNPKAMNPQVESMVDAQSDLQRLVKHGYAVASVGVRGSGASFGRFEGLFSPNETRDAFDVMEWLVQQSWCDGNLGMFGGSYLGMTQYMAASQGHPALKAIFPNVAGFDLYEVLYPGGIFREDMIQHWDQLTELLDNQLTAAPVLADPEGQLLKKAIEQHAENWPVLEEYRKAKYRDTVSESHSWSTHNPAGVLESIQKARVPAYHWNGFHDIFVTDCTLWFANYQGPQKLGIGPWSHGPFHDRRFMEERQRLRTIEQHRWFDYWLKGIDNGIMDEPPVHYAILDEEKTWNWKSANQWPPEGTKDTAFYFASGPSGSIESINDGRLQRNPPPTDDPADRYMVDLTTTTGTASRWDNAVGQGPLRYGDLSENDRKSLTYTTQPLESQVTVTGHPVVTLFISSSAEDVPFHVLLEEVDDQGKSIYVTEGVLRASHRFTRNAPWNNLGLPWHRCYEQDLKPLIPGQVTELKLDLHPTAVVFNEDHRIRVTVMCADRDNTKPLEASEGATVQVHHQAPYLSRIVLPIQPQK